MDLGVIVSASEIEMGSVAVTINVMIRNERSPNGDRNLLQLDAGLDARMFLSENNSQKTFHQK